MRGKESRVEAKVLLKSMELKAPGEGALDIPLSRGMIGFKTRVSHWTLRSMGPMSWTTVEPGTGQVLILVQNRCLPNR